MVVRPTLGQTHGRDAADLSALSQLMDRGTSDLVYNLKLLIGFGVVEVG